MEFFCYHRDRPDSAALREELVEAHWSYMDGFAEQLIVRGPTFLDDETPTGSVHVVDVADAAAARAFAFDEPIYQAGGYRDVLIRRWDDRLGRAAAARGHATSRRYLVIGLGGPADDAPAAEAESLIAHGRLLSDDGRIAVGTAVVLHAPDAAAAHAVLAAERYAAIEVHNWEPGGRR